MPRPDKDGYSWSLPIVAEAWDGYLNDINGFHVKPEDTFNALDGAHAGPSGSKGWPDQKGQMTASRNRSYRASANLVLDTA
jgi:peptidase S58-like protein